MTNHYRTLGVSPDASPAEIALAYQDHAWSQEREQAFRILSNPHLREEHDRRLNGARFPITARKPAGRPKIRLPGPVTTALGTVLLILAAMSPIGLVYLSGDMAFQLRDAGNQALEQGDLYNALQKHRRAAAVNHQDPDYRSDLARTYLALERYPDAIQEYTQALELDPEHPQALVGRAQDWQQTGAEHLARKDLTAARRLGIPPETTR